MNSIPQNMRILFKIYNGVTFGVVDKMIATAKASKVNACKIKNELGNQ